MPVKIIVEIINQLKDTLDKTGLLKKLGLKPDNKPKINFDDAQAIGERALNRLQKG